MQNPLDFLVSQVSEKPIVKIENNTISIVEIIYVSIIILIAYGIFLAAKILLSVQIKRNKIRGAQGRALLQLFGYIVTISAFFFSAASLGYSLGYLFLGSTALLVGLGFGLQQLFLDVISGIILLIDKNVNMGDVVTVDIPSGKESLHGKIFHVGLRATLLQTIDNEFIIIPNNKLLANGVRSLMRDKGSARFRIQVQVEYKQDMEKAKKILSDAVLKDNRIDREPYPTVIIRDFKDNGVLLEVRFWMRELFNSESILSDIRFEILKDFNDNNIVIPYPQRVVRATDGTDKKF